MAVLLVWTPAEKEQRLWVRGVLGGLREGASTTSGASTPFDQTQKEFGFEPKPVAAA
jgi:hypothetical protein